MTSLLFTVTVRQRRWWRGWKEGGGGGGGELSGGSGETCTQPSFSQGDEGEELRRRFAASCCGKTMWSGGT